jgi:tetratricopeptide (TPR) repeat protein
LLIRPTATCWRASEPKNGKFKQVLLINFCSRYQESTTDPDKIREAGNKLFTDTKYETATAMYDRAIRYAPDLPVLYLNKALSQLRSGHFEGALESAKSALELDGNREKAIYR